MRVKSTAVRARIDVTVYARQLRRAIAALLPAKGLALIDGSGCGRWPDRLLVIGAILMSWAAGCTALERFAAARSALVRMYPSRRRPGRTYEGFVRKLARHTPRLLAVLVEALRRRTVELSPPHCGKVGRWTLFGADSTKLDCPMTAANERGLGVASRDKSWPQVLLTTLVHLGSQLPWAWRVGGARASEREQLRLMLEELPAGSMLVMDAGFAGFDLIKTILAQGQSILLRVGSNVRLLQKLGLVAREHDGVVYLWPAEAQKRRLTPLVLRKVELRDGRNRVMVLLSDVLDESLLSDGQALEVYRMRWGVELMYRAVKQTLGRRKLLSDSPHFTEVEAQWLMAGVWTLGLLLCCDGHRHERTGRQGAGVAPALRAVRAAMAGFTDPHGRDLLKRLRESVPDSYTRRGGKAARHWPHRKNPKPPGQPLARMATAAEVELARELQKQRQAA
jgi:hypothetical protein